MRTLFMFTGMAAWVALILGGLAWVASRLAVRLGNAPSSCLARCPPFRYDKEPITTRCVGCCNRYGDRASMFALIYDEQLRGKQLMCPTCGCTHGKL